MTKEQREAKAFNAIIKDKDGTIKVFSYEIDRLRQIVKDQAQTILRLNELVKGEMAELKDIVKELQEVET